MFFRWCFELDKAISEAILRDRLTMSACALDKGGALVPCLVAPLFGEALTAHYYADPPRHPSPAPTPRSCSPLPPLLLSASLG